MPENYRGIYWCDIDSANLLVNKNSIYKSKLFDVAISNQEIDSTKELTYNNGQLFYGTQYESFPATQRNDTVYSKIILIDTIFLNKKTTHVLKYYKGHLILNNKIDENLWEVKIISKTENGYLNLSRVDYPENLTNLDSLTTVKRVEDTYREQIIITPTKAEFDQILNSKIIFGNTCQEFKPIKH